jgi:hypothetical protein
VQNGSFDGSLEQFESQAKREIQFVVEIVRNARSLVEQTQSTERGFQVVLGQFGQSERQMSFTLFAVYSQENGRK